MPLMTRRSSPRGCARAAVAEEVGLIANLRRINQTVRSAGLKVFIVPHRRWEAGDYECWCHPNPTQLGIMKRHSFARGEWEDAMAIVRVMQETLAQSPNLPNAGSHTDDGHPCCDRRRLILALSPVWPPLLRMTDLERRDFEQLLALVAVARPVPSRGKE
jgi:hypothetical protein